MLYSINPTRFVLDGVPKIGFYEGGPRCPEDIPLPSVLRALTEYIDEADYGCKFCRAARPNCQINCSYAFFLGVTGAAFFLSWKDGWHPDNGAAFYLAEDAAAMEKNAFRAIGYHFDWIMPSPDRDNQAVFLPPIVESLQRGLPVVSYGVMGPPEAGLITGYDEAGDVLLGWNFFQKLPEFTAGVTFEPAGYFRKRDWAGDTACLLIVGEKQSKPPLKETYRTALEFALQVVRTPMVRPGPHEEQWYRHRHNGLAAYTAWAEHLLRDEAFPPDDEATLCAHHAIHNDAVGYVAEARWYGGQFLIEVANPDHMPFQMAEDLYHAAALYAGEHELMWQLWDLAGGNGNPLAYRTLAEPSVRRQMAQIILEARDKDARAADHIAHALAR